MKLIRLHIENFGTLQNFDLSFTDGLNVLYQQNGWGKSTLAVFIKAMLYGLPATTRRSLDENERKKYAPWQGGAFGGNLEFSCQSGSYRIERFFGAKESGDSFALYDLSTNKPSNAFSAALGEELFGIDADGFERSTYLSQRALDTGRENNSISAKLGDLLDDVGDIGSYDTAMEALDKRRRHYVMTGNRGAIAEMEQARVEKQSELERCQRVRDAMNAQEQELQDLSEQIDALQKTAAQARERLQKASLARERAAHLERRSHMQSELNRLQALWQENDTFFHGEVPSEQTLEQSRALYGQIRKESVRLETLSGQTANAEELNRLHATYDTNAEALLCSVTQKNTELTQVEEKHRTLLAAKDDDALSERFPNGAPTQQQIDRAFTALQNADGLQRSLNSFKEPVKKRSHLTWIGLVTLLLGAVLALIGWFVLSVASAPVLPIFGITTALVGAVLLTVGRTRSAALQKKAAALRAKKQEWQSRREAELGLVREMLVRYGYSADTNASRALTELSLLANQYRAGQQKRARIQEQLALTDRRREELVESIRRAFLRFSVTLPIRNDYRPDIERVRRELALLERLEKEAAARENACRGIEAELNGMKDRLLLFLKKYDPVGRMRAGECLDCISERLAERARLSREIAEKENALKTFVAEKQLDGLAKAPEPEDLDRLQAEERAVMEKLESAQRRHTLLKSGIDRLSLDADRIPDLEAELEQMKEQIDEARANAATVASTAKLLEEAKTALSTRYLDGMQESFHGFLEELVGKEAPDALMDTSFEVRLREGGQTRTMESFSRGWRDAVQFCVRLSLSNALYPDGEPPFLLLDDPFVNLDDRRLSAARSLLDRLAQTHQILYLVCHRDRV